MKKKITLLDGAVGTSLWGIAEKNGVELRDCYTGFKNSLLSL